MPRYSPKQEQLIQKIVETFGRHRDASLDSGSFDEQMRQQRTLDWFERNKNDLFKEAKQRFEGPTVRQAQPIPRQEAVRQTMESQTEPSVREAQPIPKVNVSAEKKPSGTMSEALESNVEDARAIQEAERFQGGRRGSPRTVFSGPTAMKKPTGGGGGVYEVLGMLVLQEIEARAEGKTGPLTSAFDFTKEQIQKLGQGQMTPEQKEKAQRDFEQGPIRSNRLP